MDESGDVGGDPSPSVTVEVQTLLAQGELPVALNVMVGAALHGYGELEELQELYLSLVVHEDWQVRALATLCLGHLARVFLRLDEPQVVPVLRRLRADPDPNVAGNARTALEDIETFLHPRRAWWRGRVWLATHPRAWF